MSSKALPAEPTNELEALILGRDGSLFAKDIEDRRKEIVAAVRNARILIIGGAGSIGSVNVDLLLGYTPAAMDIVDISENGLAELVRNLRSSRTGISISDFRTIPIDYGSPIMERLLRDSPPYDLVLNFAALKHVRSEKDVYSLLQMLDTNVVKQLRFKRWLDQTQSRAAYFAVSTDKAANPTSLMGASKRLMEDVIFAPGPLQSVTSARFANVAFSNGSLLQSFLIRLARRQPLAAPRDTLRYFVSMREAGDICLIAALTAPTGHLLVPRFDPSRHLRKLVDVAEQVLRHFQLEPVQFTDEESARNSVQALVAQGRYPLLVTPLDTSGEKSFEEFVGEGEAAVELGLRELLGIPHKKFVESDENLFGEIVDCVQNSGQAVSKETLVRVMLKLLPNMNHVETGKNLDQRV